MTASGNGTGELPPHVELERRYRRLLWAYPVGYRRAHGEEILSMLMDSAEPGRRVPARADMVDLVRGAVRQWFRLPVGLSAVVAAVVAAVVLGAVGAAAASWLAWQTAADLPSDEAALQAAEAAAGAPFSAPRLTRIDHVRATSRTVSVGANSPNEQRFPDWTIEAAQARLQADGWTLGPVEKSYSASLDNQPLINQRFEVTRDGLALTVLAYTFTSNQAGAGVQVGVQPVPPSGEPGAALLGWLVGGATGWLLTGWASYRFRRRGLPRRLAALTLGLTALWLVTDTTIDTYRILGELAFAEPGVGFIAPAYYWHVTEAEQVIGALAIGLTILALAASGRHRPTSQPTAAAV
ncbi:hypothetical protein [Micromonospora sp. SH-82]|uniref:hypothetical protein n=1 Tax=Micromonospora sp. SH-82 TaxID=3132938 RepID=UPI003EBFDCC5